MFNEYKFSNYINKTGILFDNFGLLRLYVRYECLTDNSKK